MSRKNKIISSPAKPTGSVQVCPNCENGKIGKHDCIACGGSGRRRV